MPASIRPLRVALVCAVLTSGCLPTMVAHAQGNPLDLDPSFAGDGTLEIQLALNDYAAVGVFEGSGEIVVFGDSAPANPSNREGIMQRITADGTPLTPARFPAQEFGCSVPRAFFSGIRLSTGDYLAGGFRQASCGGLPRVFSNLQLQSSGGITQTFDEVPFSNQLALVLGQVEQADGRIIAVGLVSGSGFNVASYDVGVARFLANGTLDTTFGSNGTFRWDHANARDNAYDVTIDAQGRILISGVVTSATGLDWVVLALDNNGALDSSFGTNGVFLYDRAGFDDGANELAVLPSGRIVVAGVTRADALSADFTVLGLTQAGALDPGFGTDGVAIVDFGSSVASANAITVGPGGLIYVAGSAEIGGSGREARDAVLTVLRADGTPDTRLNGGAGVSFEFGDLPADFPQSIDVDATGERILVTGFTDVDDQSNQRMGVARLIGLDSRLFADGYE